MSVITNISAPDSSVRQGAFRNEWINASFLDTNTWRELFDQAGNIPHMYDFLDIPEKKIYIANDDMTIFEKQYPQDSALLAAAISTGAAGADISVVIDATQITSDKHPFRVGMSFLVPAQYQPAGVVVAQEYRIESLTDTNTTDDTCVCTPVNIDGTYSTSAQISTQIPAGERLALGPSSWGPGTDQPDGMTYSWASRTFTPRTLKETSKNETGVAAHKWLEPIKLDLIGGGQGMLSKAHIDAEKRLRRQCDTALIAGIRNDNAALVATSNVGGSNIIRTNDGIGSLASKHAQNVTYTGDLVIDDFDEFAAVWESVGMAAKNAVAYMSPVVLRMIQRSGLDIISTYSGGSDLLNREKNRLGITLQGITRGAVNYSFYPLATLVDPAGLGVLKSDGTYMYPEYAEMMLIVPEMNVEMKMKSGYNDYMTGEARQAGMGTFPNMFLGIVNNNGESLERYGGVLHGPSGYRGPNDPVATPYAKTEVYRNTDMTLIWGEINKTIYVRKLAS